GPADLLGEWAGLSAVTPGDRVRVDGPGGASEGRVRGVDEEGALLLEGADGVSLRVPFGEIVEPI
ncbi:MAG TPA: biotin--[acetyl-CoA-carboxylase] ligase, partial [Candidatus Polarisedimenticolia bacterium]